MEQVPCPDGYLLDSKSPLAQGHHVLNGYLVTYEESGWKTAAKQVNGLRDKVLKLQVWKALLERFIWLRANRHGGPYHEQLHGLVESIEKWKLSPTESDLIHLLRATGELADYTQPYTPMPHLMAYVQEHGLTPKLNAAIREFDARVRKSQYCASQTSRQLLNSRLDMLAWRDEWNEIDLKRCWSEQLRADYRAMQGSERENWRRLLYSIEGDEGVRPSAGWLRQAQAQIAAIGVPVFRARLLRWFEPLRRGRVQKLSREGSFLLRSFIFLAQSLNDPELMARVAEIAEVEFKPKANGEKVMRAATEVAGTDLPQPPAKPMPSLDALTARALAVTLSARMSSEQSRIADRVRIENEVVHVRGDLDTYRIHISTGAVFRDSDGWRVHVAGDTGLAPMLAKMDAGGMAQLLAQIYILAEDEQHRDALVSAPE